MNMRTGVYRSSRNIQPTGVPAGPVVVNVALMEIEVYCTAGPCCLQRRARTHYKRHSAANCQHLACHAMSVMKPSCVTHRRNSLTCQTQVKAVGG